MTQAIIVTATDTNVGKSVFSSALVAALGGYYWKPVQAGVSGETDSEVVARLSGLPPERILPEVYRLNMPASPLAAARDEGITLYPQELVPPSVDGPLVIEGAGGLMVPLTKRILLIDVMASWRAPIVLCARTSLGTINHTLLSIEALNRRNMPVVGVAFIGEPDEAAEQAIVSFGAVRRLGRLPPIDPLDRAALAKAFAANFNLADFTAAMAG
jgi:dethiobiotin synthetase